MFNPLTDVLLTHRFVVYFLPTGGVVNLAKSLDFRFRKVSGLKLTVNTTPLKEGGQSGYIHTLPDQVQQSTLKLERGLPLGSPLSHQVEYSLRSFRFHTSDVMVSLLSEEGIPLAAWLFRKAYPVSWDISEFSAEQPAVVIQTLELAYTRRTNIQV